MEEKMPASVRLSIDKILYFIYMVYVTVLSPKGIFVPYLASVLLALSVFGTFCFHKTTVFRLFRRSRILLWLFTFLLVNFVFGWLTSASTSAMLSQCKFILECYLDFVIIMAISIDDGSIKYVTNLMLFTSLLMTALLIVAPVRFTEIGNAYYTFSKQVNPHIVGMFAVLGIWCLINKVYQKGSSSVFLFICIVFLIGVYTYAIILANSRKSLIAEAIVLLLSFFPLIKFLKKKAGFAKRIFIYLFIAACIFLTVRVFMAFGLMERTNIWDRLINQQNDEGNTNRWLLIKDGLRVFSEHPIFGVGLDNYRFNSTVGEAYTHCTYSEILSCCGIVGTLPFVLFFIALFRKVLAVVPQKAADRFAKRLTVSMLLMTLVLAWTQILFYQRIWMIILAIAAAYSALQEYPSKNEAPRSCGIAAAPSGQRS